MSFLLASCFIFLSGFFQFSFHWFLSVSIDMPRYILGGYLFCLVLLGLPGSVVWYLTLFFFKFSVVITLNISFILLSCASGIPMAGPNLGCSVLFYSFLSLHISVCEVFWPLFKLTDSFLSHAKSTNVPIKGFFSFLFYCFWVLVLPFDSFLEFQSLIIILPICSWMLSIFSIDPSTF